MKFTFFFSCCVARFIEDILTNRRRRRKCIFWSIIVGSLATVFIVTALRDALLASRFICTVEDIVSNHITKLCEVTDKEKELDHSHTPFRQDLCEELCAPDVSSRITCHTFHLNKPTVFTLDGEGKKVIKSVIKLEDREEPVVETSTEENEVYWNLKPGSHQYFPTKDDFLSMELSAMSTTPHSVPHSAVNQANTRYSTAVTHQIPGLSTAVPHTRPGPKYYCVSPHNCLSYLRLSDLG
ncbi:uncharacterized protein aln isoform X3 [Panulirus ornatus]|uniref:uncharacterized protein aln isoform X3 n=1 Tax=Panulirus ornatus TaxID=150431 RepID=UPI003A8AA506